jgi:predicted ester cyclase
MKSLKKEALLPTFSAVLITLVFLAGCQPPPPADYSKELKPLVDAYNAAWESGNVDALDAIFDPNFVRHSDPGSSAEGLANLKKVIRGFKTSYPDVKLVSEEEIYSKDKFAGRWSFTATHTGPGDIPPTGKSVKQWGINIIHFKNGKIVEEWDGFDNLPLLEQLGYTITPPSGSK